MARMTMVEVKKVLMSAMSAVFLSFIILCSTIQTANAGMLFLFAESAQFTSDSSGCTKTTSVITNASTANTIIECEDGGTNPEFVLPMAIPPDMPAAAAFNLTFTYLTADSGATRVCSWDAEVNAFRDTASRDNSDGTPVAVTSPSQTHSTTTFYTTNTTSSVAVWDVLAAGNCASSNCNNKYANMLLVLNSTTTTASFCGFRMAALEY